jgi:hypothetical protein
MRNGISGLLTAMLATAVLADTWMDEGSLRTVTERIGDGSLPTPEVVDSRTKSVRFEVDVDAPAFLPLDAVREAPVPDPAPASRPFDFRTLSGELDLAGWLGRRLSRSPS